MNEQLDLIIGNGRLARHLTHLYKREGLHCLHWNRKENDLSSLQDQLHRSNSVLLCISDDSLESFVRPFEDSLPHRLFHFSGSLSMSGVCGLHPIAAFGTELYPDSFYDRLFWTIDSECSRLPAFIKSKPLKINPADKPLYHSLLSLNSNLPQLLSLITRAHFEKWNWPKEALNSLIESTALLTQQTDFKVPSGPQFRGDVQTIERHKTALHESELLPLYEVFVQLAATYRSSLSKHKGESV